MWSLAGISITTPLQPQAFTTSISSGIQRPKAKISDLRPRRGDLLNRCLVLRGDGGHSGFDAVNAEGIELLGDGDFFLAAEDHGGLLLAVAQGHIMNLDLLGESVVFSGFRRDNSTGWYTICLSSKGPCYLHMNFDLVTHERTRIGVRSLRCEFRQ